VNWVNGLQGSQVADSAKLGGQLPSAYLGANQKAADSDKLDGLDSSNFAAYKRTVVVSPVGTPTQNGTALKNALGGISDASESNPYLLKIEPGIYDVGSANNNPLIMKPYVDVEGSGEGITTITATGFVSSSPNPNFLLEGYDNATVAGTANSELRFLTVKSTGGSIAKAIFGDANNFRLTNVTAVASDGGSWNFGVYVGSGRGPTDTMTINQSTLTAHGQAATIGIAGDPLGDVFVRNSQIRASVNRLATFCT